MKKMTYIISGLSIIVIVCALFFVNKSFKVAKVSLESSQVTRTESSMHEIPSISTNADFKTQILDAKKPAVVKFYATWCQTCKKMAPILESIAQKYKNTYIFAEVDADKNPDIVKDNGVIGVPSFLFFKDGKEVDRKVGDFDQATLEKAMNKALE